MRSRIALASLLAVVGCGAEPPPPEIPLRAIKWVRVQEEGAAEERRISGTVRPTVESQLSFEVSGRVRRVVASLGDRVSKGDVLAELDVQPFELAVHRAQARVSQAEAERIRQQAEFARYQRMLDAGAVSQSAYDRVRAAHANAEGLTRAARAELGLARRDLNNAVLRAPFDGVISLKKVDAFVEVPAGEPLFELDSERSYEVALAAPEAVALYVAAGDPVTVVFPTLAGERVPGRISQLGSRAGIADAFPMKIRLLERPEKMRPGMTVEAEFVYVGRRAASSGVHLPLAALRAEADDAYSVFVYDAATGTVKRTEIVVSGLRNNQVEVSEGLEAGMIVAAAGVEFLSDDQPVTLFGAEPEQVAGGRLR